jgi:gluconolactonase
MTVSVSQEKTNYTNGITYHPSGDLLRAEMGGNGVGKITRVDAAGVVTVIADKNANGEPLHTPDDLVVRSDGTIYFTDPTFAHGPALGDSLFDRPVYRITPAALGQRVILEDAMPSPNGVELTRDEKTLYVASYLDEIVYAYPVAADGALGPRKVFARAIDDADSMCLDAADNLYVGASSGLRIIRADGTALGNIPMPSGDKVTNCEFGGGDGKTLYITARKTLWRIDAMPIFGLQWEKHRSLPCAK